MVNQRRGYQGRFVGARLNVEAVPRLPAAAVRAALEDPLCRSYAFIWLLEGRPVNGVGEIAYSVVACREEGIQCWPMGPSTRFSPGPGGSDRRGGEVQTKYRRLPRGYGVELLILCGSCEEPVRFLFAWRRKGNACSVAGGWECRRCAGLSFASEGQWDRFGWGYPRQDPWDPYVFPSLDAAHEFLGSCGE